MALLHTDSEKGTPRFSMYSHFLPPLTSESNGAAKIQRKLRYERFLATEIGAERSSRVLCVVHPRVFALFLLDLEHGFVHTRMLF